MNRLQSELNIQKRDVQLRILATNLSITEKENQLAVLEDDIEKAKFEMERYIGYRNALDMVSNRVSDIMAADAGARQNLEEKLKSLVPPVIEEG